MSAPHHADGFGREEWTAFAALGWLGVAIPEEQGGSAGGATELGIVMAAVGGGLALEPVLQTVVLGAAAIQLAGTGGQQLDHAREVAVDGAEPGIARHSDAVER